ncbi:hypothetical protein WJX74_003967 [Apatococcus lobatus]|uniref:J domain-containing protein n=1 Tax=Apatococcus lobatus TaxID=904363 RepID=A0AAW1RWH8_9CHLO
MVDPAAGMLTTRAREAFERKDFLLAHDLYEKAVEKLGLDVALSLSLCACCAALHRWEGALAAAQQLLSQAGNGLQAQQAIQFEQRRTAAYETWLKRRSQQEAASAQQREAEVQASAGARITQQLRAAEQALLQEKMENLWEDDATDDLPPAPENLPTRQGPEVSKAAGDALQLLGLNYAADQHAIRRAYFTAAASSHPDKGGTAEAFVAVQRAYQQALSALPKPQSAQSVEPCPSGLSKSIGRSWARSINGDAGTNVWKQKLLF